MTFYPQYMAHHKTVMKPLSSRKSKVLNHYQAPSSPRSQDEWNTSTSSVMHVKKINGNLIYNGSIKISAKLLIYISILTQCRLVLDYCNTKIT